MNDGSEPRWELLPHHPEQFFGLSGDYDLRDLKRSYNLLIRRYKPEKFPAEFQRIRAAYEGLNDALRYGLGTGGGGTPSSWPTSLEKAADPPQDTKPPFPPPERPPQNKPQPQRPPPPPQPHTRPMRGTDSWTRQDAAEVSPAPLREQILSTPLATLYSDLSSRPVKTGTDYLALALMSDVLAQADGASPAHLPSFVDWLLAGLRGNQNDWGLTQLLREYLSQDHVPANLAALLLRVVNVLPTSRFQYVTEKAWDRMLRDAPLADFRECLQRCGVHLGKSVDHAQLVFYVHILKLAMWKADDDFLAQMREVVEDHFHSLGRGVQGEFEMVSMLLDYKAQREQFVARGPCCQRIDQAIRHWCVLPETEGDASVLDCQYFLNLRGRQLLEEFPDYNADFAYVLLPWSVIVSEVLDRLDEPEKLDERVLVAQVKDCLIRANRRQERVSKHNDGCMLVLVGTFVWLIAFVAGGTYCMYTCLALLLQGSFLPAFLWGLALLGTTIVYLAGSVTWLNWGNNTFLRFRYEIVRLDLLRLMRVAPLLIDELVKHVKARRHENFGKDEYIQYTKEIAEGLRSDAGLEFFSLAQRCLIAAVSERIRPDAQRQVRQ